MSGCPPAGRRRGLGPAKQREPCPGQENKPQAPVPRHELQPPLQAPTGLRSSILAASQPSISLCQHYPPTHCAKGQDQSPSPKPEQLPSLPAKYLVLRPACDPFQLLWPNLPRPAVPLLTPSALCSAGSHGKHQLCRGFQPPHP